MARHDPTRVAVVAGLAGSAPPCVLLGRGGKDARVRVLAMKALLPGEDWFTPPLASLRALGPAERVSLGIWWSNWCPPGTTLTTPGAPPKALALELAGGGELRLPLREAPRCDA